ncbi:MAG TPA: MFS transporter [Acidimicrobiales bacterium]|nr:MFS transporter [Acidimicrobiales bacterium]
MTLTATAPTSRRTPALSHGVAFWTVTLAFLLNMAFSAVPTPLYVLYQGRDHFSDVMITVVYAVYAVGVIASLFLAGHVSDWVGRRRVLVPALLVNVAAAAVFLLAPSLPGLIVARVISGISVGITTATATAYLAELHVAAGGSPTGRKAQVVATAANLGGIGVGPLAAGFLAQWVPSPLVVPYVVFGLLLIGLSIGVAAAPETAVRPDPLPQWRPQRVAVPAHARGQFYAATAAGVASFAVYGVFNSLVPTFLAGTLHETSHAVAGAVAFSAFAAGAAAQIWLGRLGSVRMLRVSVPLLVAGMGLFAAGMWLPSLVVFVVGGVVTGAGAGLLFRGSLVAAGLTAPAGARAEVLAGFFLGAYVGLSIPVIGLGVAATYVPARDVMLVFVALVAVAAGLAVGAVGRRTGRP